jgi:hypothetical protein
MRSIFPKAGWMLNGVLALYVLSALAGAVTGGPLDPPGPPGPTQKTLDLIPGSWAQLLDSTDGDGAGCGSSRFRCVMSGEAVLDLETGLVWQLTASACADCPWEQTFNGCLSAEDGGRQGWRLPRIEELMSLIDPVTNLPAADGPISLAGTSFWSATTAAGTAFVPKHAYTLEFDAESNHFWSSRHKETEVVDASMCVRGGGGEGFRS